jgi:hypothetical protein
MKELEKFKEYIESKQKFSLNKEFSKPIEDFFSDFKRETYIEELKEKTVCAEIAPRKEMADFLCNLEKINNIRNKTRKDFFVDNYIRMEGVKHNCIVKNNLINEMAGAKNE